MIAYERMKPYAMISIIDVLLRLLAVLLLYNLSFDKLAIWALLLSLVTFIVLLITIIYCKATFKACNYKYVFDKLLLKDMMSFTGWNVIGSSASIFRIQGVNIVLNIFCGPTINAARGVSVQVNSAINNFVHNFNLAINPQIIKSYSLDDNSYMFSLIQRGSRFSFYMLLLLSLPVVIETPFILNKWLGVVPEFTVDFVRLMLIYSLIESISHVLITAVMATGKIRNYQIIVGSLELLNLPISYLFLWLDYSPEVVFIIAIFISIICLITRLFIVKKLLSFDVNLFLRTVIFNVVKVSFLSSLLPLILSQYIVNDFIRFIVVVCVCLISTSSVIFYIGCNNEEQTFLKSKLIVILKKIY